MRTRKRSPLLLPVRSEKRRRPKSCNRNTLTQSRQKAAQGQKPNKTKIRRKSQNGAFCGFSNFEPVAASCSPPISKRGATLPPGLLPPSLRRFPWGFSGAVPVALCAPLCGVSACGSIGIAPRRKSSYRGVKMAYRATGKYSNLRRGQNNRPALYRARRLFIQSILFLICCKGFS